MIRKEGPDLYQIGIYSLTKVGRRGWEAFSTCILGDYRRTFPSIAAAHLNLTGEPLDKREFARISRATK